jgi:hypothetical protein
MHTRLVLRHVTLETVGEFPANTTTITVTNREIIIVDEADRRLWFDETKILIFGMGGRGVGAWELN